MTTRRIAIAQRLVLAGILLLSLWTVRSAWGQGASAEIDRLERRLDGLDRGATSTAIEIEKRFSAFEMRQAVMDSKLDLLLKIGGVIGFSLIGLVINAAWGGVARSREKARRKDTME